jgi:16S rRNA C1402 (ribose-2'-O) methylase RsmI
VFLGHCKHLTFSNGAERQGDCCADVSVTLVFYVPPHSLDAVLADMAAVFTGTRQCVIAREITKVLCSPLFCKLCHLMTVPQAVWASAGA